MKYPIGIQSFEKLRTEGCVYVDKTEFVYKLASTGSYYFLSRPRRFGKSLLLSTLKAYFEGKKELFGGLAIERLEQDWAEYPVLYLDLTGEEYAKESDLEERFDKTIGQWEEVYGKSDGSPAVRFESVIRRAYGKTGKKVVILVDEYDKPLVETIDNRELQEKYRRALKAFYSVLKAQDQYIRFAFLTGVSRFGKVSVFSDLNNLKDISMDARYSAVCGITEREIDAYFKEEVARLAENMRLSVGQARMKLKEQYDGYHFCEDCEGMYNPFSLLNALDGGKIGNYWFDTATPTMLAKLLMDTDYRLDELGEATATPDMLGSIETMHDNPIPLIYQSGYLTIHGYDPLTGEYQLGFPNREVESGFKKAILYYYIPATRNTTEFGFGKFLADANGGKAEDFMKRLRAMFASMSYKVAGEKELYFQNAVSIFFTVMGLVSEVERYTSEGRIDLVMTTGKYIYVMEFKLDGKAEEALKQIDDKNYTLQYSVGSRKIIKIGVNFSSSTRNITDWKIV
ncbi:MAG: ATP-binding protein [Bacteroidales bacterium]|nr:ATP-binding protein [Bacteroidales bacterium]